MKDITGSQRFFEHYSPYEKNNVQMKSTKLRYNPYATPKKRCRDLPNIPRDLLLDESLITPPKKKLNLGKGLENTHFHKNLTVLSPPSTPVAKEERTNLSVVECFFEHYSPYQENNVQRKSTKFRYNPYATPKKRCRDLPNMPIDLLLDESLITPPKKMKKLNLNKTIKTKKLIYVSVYYLFIYILIFYFIYHIYLNLY